MLTTILITLLIIIVFKLIGKCSTEKTTGQTAAKTKCKGHSKTSSTASESSASLLLIHWLLTIHGLTVHWLPVRLAVHRLSQWRISLWRVSLLWSGSIRWLSVSLLLWRKPLISRGTGIRLWSLLILFRRWGVCLIWWRRWFSIFSCSTSAFQS